MIKKQYSVEIASQIKSLLNQRTKAPSDKQRSIREKIRLLGFYISEYWTGFNELDFDNEVKAGRIIITNETLSKPIINTNIIIDDIHRIPKKAKGRINSDEYYIINICDKLLNKKSLRQHEFDFLKGDSGKKLPVDAYYPDLNLVIEYRERQHTEVVPLFDNKPTVSGVNRGEQRKIYDRRRETVLPKHGINVLIISFF